MDALVQRAMRGDRDAFGDLAGLVIDRLYGLAFRVLRDRTLAEDAVQAALLSAWRDMPSLQAPGRFDAWLRRILVRACFAEAGRQRAFARQVDVVALEPWGPDAAADTADRDQVERALGRLPVDQRAIVALHFYVGLPMVDVAEALGIPDGTARSRLHYALKSLRAAVDADDRTARPTGRTA